jgi:hypothetical protein
VSSSNELDKDIAEAMLPRTTEALNWWKNRTESYSRIHTVVKGRLCVVVILSSLWKNIK